MKDNLDMFLNKFGNGLLLGFGLGKIGKHSNGIAQHVTEFLEGQGLESEERMYTLEELQYAYTEGEFNGAAVAINPDYYVYDSRQDRFDKLVNKLK